MSRLSTFFGSISICTILLFSGCAVISNNSDSADNTPETIEQKVVEVTVDKKENKEEPQVENSTAPAGLASCLKEKGLTFYGAYWCPHCIHQKKMFGDEGEQLPYIECSLPERKGQTDECKNAGITGYPTWEFPDGTRKNGAQDYAFLAEKAGCEI